jgi:hypothetical protein
MKVVGVEERQAQPGRQLSAERGLSGAHHAHHQDQHAPRVSKFTWRSNSIRIARKRP